MTQPHHSSLHYILVWLALSALALVTFGLSFLPLGHFDVPVSMAIAFAKTLLVALFFMHLIEQRAANRIVPVVALLLVAILIGITAADVATRRTYPKAPAPPAKEDQDTTP